ncbi:SDR family oxidoreductase [Schumannella sp. 10F1B-5-1]|uniref:SDR family oxidoreductase n=1 Tax=Schumannella sp. 10F1B-5-1 TaxID=2590780 RepID=UPI001131DB0E|nr:SDR family oxidoreductase [Schumannella sp. 10F1B-5-1]TPW73548.1 SDR family oxidoreductase [Schumannella sp. 10F1B-5-1]
MDRGSSARPWLVTGATGLLGANAMHALQAAGIPAVGVARRPPDRDDVIAVDLLDESARRDVVERLRPSTILHAAALADIEACERDPDLARRMNVEAAEALAREGDALGARFIHISTDAVFDGRRGGYRVDETTSPTHVYGATKAESEHAVLDTVPSALVARVDFFGWSPSGRRSLAEFFHRGLVAGDVMRGFTDVRVSTLHVGHLIGALRALSARSVDGIQHVTARDSVSKYDFGRRLALRFGFDPNLIRPARSRDVLVVARGSDISLDTTATATRLGSELPTVQDGLDELHREFERGVPQLIRDWHPKETT